MRITWDEMWAATAQQMAQRSLCVRGQTGAVIVSPSQKVLSTGYNGPPAGLRLSTPCTDWCPRATKLQGDLDPAYGDCLTIHAEVNALLHSDATERKGGTIYTNQHICYACAKQIANSGLATVVVRATSPATWRKPRRSYELLYDSGLDVDAKTNNIVFCRLIGDAGAA